jgi:hypothetical protein
MSGGRMEQWDRDNLKASLRSLISDAEKAIQMIDSGDIDRTKGAMFGVECWYKQAMIDTRKWIRWKEDV